MYDLWELKEWHASQKQHSGNTHRHGGLDTLDARDPQADEEVPRPFLNEYMPTQDEIRRSCLEIQKEWTESERRRRRGQRRAHRQVHTLRVVRTALSGY
jgi:hypothetical protein